MMRLQLCARLLLLWCLVSGCGGGSEADHRSLVPVAGEVLIDGSPLPQASVFFRPQGGTDAAVYYDVTDEEGKFSLRNPHGGEGAPPGNYKVVVTKYAMPDGSPIPDGMDAATADAKEVVPMAYSNPQMTALAVQVPDGGVQNIKLQLTAK